MLDANFDVVMAYHEWDESGEELKAIIPETEWRWQEYPTDNFVSERSGFKVGWRTYSDLKSANQCAYAAGINAFLKMQQGHDFGYLEPATITEIEDNNFEVVIP